MGGGGFHLPSQPPPIIYRRHPLPPVDYVHSYTATCGIYITLAAQAAASTFLVGCSAHRAASKDLLNGKITVCCAGFRGRGNSLFHEFGACDDVVGK